jgi:hypothetical protein
MGDFNPVNAVGGLVGGTMGFLGDPMGKKEMAKGGAAQARATAQANAELKQGFEEQTGLHVPWQQAGLSALADMQSGDFKRDFTANDFQADPGYAFRMAEANKAMERSAAAKGMLQSGGTLKALTRYNQDAASQEYGDAYNRFNADRDRRFNRLSSLAGMGQTAVSNMSNINQNYHNGVSGNLTGLGNAQAGMAVANANANNQLFQAAIGAGSKMASGGAK